MNVNIQLKILVAATCRICYANSNESGEPLQMSPLGSLECSMLHILYLE